MGRAAPAANAPATMAPAMSFLAMGYLLAIEYRAGECIAVSHAVKKAAVMLRRFVFLCAFAALSPSFGVAAEFYAGKTITLSTHASPGGGYDAYLRVLAAHFGNHIPGNPNIIVVNQPGAGGLTAINYAGRRAAKDGTFLTLASQGILFQQATGAAGLQVSLDDFKWIGNFVKSNDVILTWHSGAGK